MRSWFSLKDVKSPKPEVTSASTRAVAVKDELVEDTSTRVPSHDGDGTLFDDRLALTPDSIAHKIQHSRLLDDVPDNANARGNKRLKEDDEASSAFQKLKRRRSPPFESRQPGPPEFSVRSPVSSPSLLEPPPMTNDVSSPMTFATTVSQDDYTKEEDAGHPSFRLLKDLETRAITVPQLIQEVKGIYAGLAMVEKKCVEIVDAQLKSTNKLSKEQWQALIALHRTLLNEHHDFFSASHHPVTQGHELRELATRHAMPARMWRHAIHAFLELLRHKLPDSYKHMVSFLYLSYSMVALLKETVPEFVETWIECLGDLARYRMAIEEDADLRDREVWAATARIWYNSAADLSPNTGRIQHHLAVLARPHVVQQLFLYGKALVAAVPFRNAAESILLLFNPLLDPTTKAQVKHPPADYNFVCAAATLFEKRNLNDFIAFQEQFESSLQSHIANAGSKFKVQGPEHAGSLFAMFMDFGNEENKLWRLICDHQQDMKRISCELNGEEETKTPWPGLYDNWRRKEDLSELKNLHREQHGKGIDKLPDLFTSPNTTLRTKQTSTILNSLNLRYTPSALLYFLGEISEKIAACLAIFYACHLPMVSAESNGNGQTEQTQAATSTGVLLSLLFDWLVPLLTFGSVIVSDVMVERAWFGIYPTVVRSMNQKAQEFWSIFTPIMATMILPLSDQSQSGVEGTIFAFILACEINQFRRCVDKVVPAPIRLILMAAVWLPTQYFLATFTVHDTAMLRVVRWLTASFTITLVTKLCVTFQHVRRRAFVRNYDNILVTDGAVALIGDMYYENRNQVGDQMV